ncbi:hypothetical protein SDJN02_18370, partial [Cucurbita argyrosperma subsp. argyrosperma]
MATYALKIYLFSPSCGCRLMFLKLMEFITISFPCLCRFLRLSSLRSSSTARASYNSLQNSSWNQGNPKAPPTLRYQKVACW